MMKLYKKASALNKSLRADFIFLLTYFKPKQMQDDINDDHFWSEVSDIVDAIFNCTTQDEVIHLHQQIYDLYEKFKGSRRHHFLVNQQENLYKKLSRKKDRISYIAPTLSIN